jgi:dTDP-4-dehydrorhamnose 3,5-epimerase
MAFVKIDDWDNPSLDLKPEIFHISDQRSEVLCVPAGYANCLKATEPGSILQVWSDKILDVALLDSWRYPSSNWVDWSQF